MEMFYLALVSGLSLEKKPQAKVSLFLPSQHTVTFSWKPKLPNILI